ncbi:unnamed protein product [Withania somnifera]
MEAEAALELVKQGATLLLLDVPQNTLIGIDIQIFGSGPNLKSVKMIPPGARFIYYSSSNREGNDFSPIVVFFVDASPSEVIVKKWDPKDERLVILSEEEEGGYAQAVKKLEFDRQLGPYALDLYGDWKRLSNFIRKSTVGSIEPIGGKITIISESEMVENVPTTAMEKVLAEQLKSREYSKPDKKSPSKGCYYTSIPRVMKLKGASGQDLTHVNLDKTHILEIILTKQYGGSEDSLLGELQFAFVAFLMGQSLEPLHTRTQLFTKFIKAIYYPLKIGFQKDSKDTGRAEKGATTSLDESLKPRELLEQTLGWNFQQNSAVDGVYLEEDEFAPVVEILDDPDH